MTGELQSAHHNLPGYKNPDLANHNISKTGDAASLLGFDLFLLHPDLYLDR